MGLLRAALKSILPYGIVSKQQHKKNMMNACGRVNEPILYNQHGEKKRVFYLVDNSCNFSYSFTAGWEPRYIHWDRNNTHLPIHFYSNNDISTPFVGIPDSVFALLTEPEVNLVRNIKQQDLVSYAKQYTKVFTHSDYLLNKCQNAELLLGLGCWYGVPTHGGVLSDEKYKDKRKLLSMLCSEKAFLPCHVIRRDLAIVLKKKKLADVFGTVDKGQKVKAHVAFDDYMFNIAFENDFSQYFFTEKLLCCFASMTIPIYAGAEQIGEYFNTDGIIFIDKKNIFESVEKIISEISPEMYNERISAIIDNYKRVQDYLVLEDWLYKKYEALFKIKRDVYGQK